MFCTNYKPLDGKIILFKGFFCAQNWTESEKVRTPYPGSLKVFFLFFRVLKGLSLFAVENLNNSVLGHLTQWAKQVVKLPIYFKNE